jgi:hypothetical protein
VTSASSWVGVDSQSASVTVLVGSKPSWPAYQSAATARVTPVRTRPYSRGGVGGGHGPQPRRGPVPVGRRDEDRDPGSPVVVGRAGGVVAEHVGARPEQAGAVRQVQDRADRVGVEGLGEDRARLEGHRVIVLVNADREEAI